MRGCCLLCTYCCICMIAVGERCFDCCKSCNLVDSSICQFPPMVCMISSIACDIQFRGICVQAPVGLQPFFFCSHAMASVCWKVLLAPGSPARVSRPLTSVADHTLWLEVEEERENKAHTHTQHKHQRWPELCRGDVKTEQALFTELQ